MILAIVAFIWLSSLGGLMFFDVRSKGAAISASTLVAATLLLPVIYALDFVHS